MQPAAGLASFNLHPWQALAKLAPTMDYKIEPLCGKIRSHPMITEKNQRLKKLIDFQVVTV